MIKKTTCWIVLIYLSGLFIVLYDRCILPAKFFYDANHIRRLLNIPFSLHLFNSFVNTAYFYRLFGFSLNISPYVASLYSYTLGYSIIVYFLCKNRLILNRKITFIFFVWNIIFAIYMGQYSKELIALIVVIIIISINSNSIRKDFILFGMVFLFYSLFYRIYWMLIFYFFILIKIELLYRFRIFNQLISCFIFCVFTILLFTSVHFITNKYLTNSRYIVNIYRIGSADAQSILSNPLKNSSVFTDMLNTIIILIYLVFPIKLLLLKLKFEYLIFSIWEFFNSLFFMKMVFYLSRKKSIIAKTWNTVTNCIAFIMAFTIVQAMFEPDYGSFLKHQIILLPAYIYLIYIYYNTQKYYRYLRWLHESNSCR